MTHSQPARLTAATTTAALIAGLWLAATAPSAAQDGDALVGHWRQTTIRFEQPRDEHLVLAADGRMANWVVTADSRSEPVTGAWRTEERTLILEIEGGEAVSQPFTFYQGQLVFPNIPNRRGFWERIED